MEAAGINLAKIDALADTFAKVRLGERIASGLRFFTSSISKIPDRLWVKGTFLRAQLQDIASQHLSPRLRNSQKVCQERYGPNLQTPDYS